MHRLIIGLYLERFIIYYLKGISQEKYKEYAELGKIIKFILKIK